MDYKKLWLQLKVELDYFLKFEVPSIDPRVYATMGYYERIEEWEEEALKLRE